MTLFDRIHEFETVGSTMDVAREIALAGELPGAVVTTNHQTGGRGRRGRIWFAPPGANVSMTAIGWKVAAEDAWKIALVAGVAAVEAIREATVLPATVRFPNDIYLNGAKLGGILIETVPHSMPGLVTPLIGIGINVNVSADEFPPEIRGRATSIFIATGQECSVSTILGLLWREFGKRLDEFHRGLLEDTILPRWRVLSDPEAVRTFILDGAPIRCRVLDVSGDGTVTLETEDGVQRTVNAPHVILGDD